MMSTYILSIILTIGSGATGNSDNSFSNDSADLISKISGAYTKYAENDGKLAAEQKAANAAETVSLQEARYLDKFLSTVYSVAQSRIHSYVHSGRSFSQAQEVVNQYNSIPVVELQLISDEESKLRRYVQKAISGLKLQSLGAIDAEVQSQLQIAKRSIRDTLHQLAQTKQNRRAMLEMSRPSSAVIQVAGTAGSSEFYKALKSSSALFKNEEDTQVRKISQMLKSLSDNITASCLKHLNSSANKNFLQAKDSNYEDFDIKIGAGHSESAQDASSLLISRKDIANEINHKASVLVSKLFEDAVRTMKA